MSKQSFFVLVTVEPDDPNESVQTTLERIEKAVEHSTAAEALSEACVGTVTMRLAHDEDFT
jgi:hypothetical protein